MFLGECMRFNPISRAAFCSLFFAMAFIPTFGCEEKKTPEEEIRALLDRGVSALEGNRLGEAIDLLSESYLDGARRDHRKMKSLAFVILRRGPLMVFLSDIQISVSGSSATVQVKATAIQGKKKIASLQDVLPKNARKMDLRIQVLKEGSDWKVTAIDGDGFGAAF
jgi:hypothetical protein